MIIISFGQFPFFISLTRAISCSLTPNVHLIGLWVRNRKVLAAFMGLGRSFAIVSILFSLESNIRWELRFKSRTTQSHWYKKYYDHMRPILNLNLFFSYCPRFSFYLLTQNRITDLFHCCVCLSTHNGDILWVWKLWSLMLFYLDISRIYFHVAYTKRQCRIELLVKAFLVKANQRKQKKGK